MRLHHILFIAIISFITTQTIAEGNYNVIRGERPQIDYKLVDEKAYNKGILKIKFHKEYASHLEKNAIYIDDKGVAKFNLKKLDKLNETYGVKSAVKHFSSPAFKDGFTERHKAWGFHLWYRLQVDEKADIKEMIREYSRLREVEIAEPDFVKEIIGTHDEADFHFVEKKDIDNQKSWTPNDPQFHNQWHYHNTGQQNGTPGSDISLKAAWEIQKGNPDVIVAIVDGGIDYNHSDLAGNMWEDTGFNFVNNTDNIEPHNHGTHVAGTVAAVSNNNLGVAGVAGGSGSNDGVRLMSCQVFTATSNGGFHLAPVYAADNGAAISQNSWGYSFAGVYEQDVLDAIDYFNANGGGTAMDGGITIFAAGNSDSSADYYPGYYSGAFSVAATNNKDEKSWYSNYGTWVDISAPGGETNMVTERGVLSTLNNNNYGHYQGTSMACPHVSGVAALMISSVYGEFTPQDVVDILLNTVDNHYSANPGYQGQLGSGRLNAHHAVALSEQYLNMPQNPSNFEADGISDEEIELSWELNDNSDIVMIAWNDDGAFGIPQQGTSYDVGDYIDGGGTVLYMGSEQEFLHSNLNAATAYYYKIWSVSDDVSYSLGRTSFDYTQCGLYTLPVFEEFNSSELPYCWMLPDGEGNWRVSTNRGNPPPAVEFNWSPTLTNYAFSLESPPIDGDIPGNAIALEFDLMLDNYSTNTLEEMIVQVSDGDEWVNVMEFDNTNGDIPWETHFVDITPYALDNNFMVRFLATGENSFNINYWLIDNFMVYSFSCPQPYDLTADEITSESAIISWDAGGDEVLWDMVYGTPGIDPDNQGTLISNISETSYEITGLETFTSYQVYVRANCENDDISLWTGPYSFTTLATCPAPENLQISQITANTAFVSWQAVGAEDTWDLVFGSPGFNPNTDGTLIEDIQTSEYTLTGLDGVTSYDVYVRAFCDDNDVSIWLGPKSFTTICDVFTLNFEEYFADASVGCWSFPDGQGNWGFGSSYTPPSSESGAPNAVFTWSPSLVGYSHSLVSPVIDATNIQEQVKLNYKLFLNSFSSSSLEQMSVEYKAFEEDDWILLKNYSNEGAGSSNVEYVEEDIVIDDVQGKMFQIRFRAHGENSFNINAWGLDDVEIFSTQTPVYTVSIIPEGPGYTQPDGDVNVEQGENLTVEAFANEGAHISDALLDNVSVIDDMSFDDNVFPAIGSLVLSNIESNHNLVIQFDDNVYELTLVPEPSQGGTVEGSGDYVHNTEVTIKANPESNYEFVKWTHNGLLLSDQSQHTFNILSPKEIVAVFELSNEISEAGVESKGVKIFPNPASNKVWIEFFNKDDSEITISLISTYGQTILEKTVSEKGYIKEFFNIENLKPGIYFISLGSENVMKKLIVK